MANTTKVKTDKDKTVEVILVFDRLPNEAHVTAAVTAGILGCSEKTVWRLTKSGVLPGMRKIGPGCTRWMVGAIRQHLGIAA
jgi:predicted DNA-binding transcriptional regulator AlpA